MIKGVPPCKPGPCSAAEEHQIIPLDAGEDVVALGNVAAQPGQCLGYSCGSTAWEKIGADQETAEPVSKAWNVRSVVGWVLGVIAGHELVSLLGLVFVAEAPGQAVSAAPYKGPIKAFAL